MSKVLAFFGKLRRKGLRSSLRLLCERTLYYHWELLTLERSLDESFLPKDFKQGRWRSVKITTALLPGFSRYFAPQLPAIRGLLAKGCSGNAHLDDDGNVIMMLWVNESDYYDDQLYRAWFRIPPNCIYQFFVECAVPYRGSGLALLAQSEMWDEYRGRGFDKVRSVVNTRNEISLKMHVRGSYQEVGESVHVYCLFRCLHFNRLQRYTEPRLEHLRKPATRFLVNTPLPSADGGEAS